MRYSENEIKLKSERQIEICSKSKVDNQELLKVDAYLVMKDATADPFTVDKDFSLEYKNFVNTDDITWLRTLSK